MRPFPRDIAGQTFPDAPTLAATVRADAQAGGGTVVPGEHPSTWLGRALTEDEVERELIVGLCAALIRAGHPASVVEAAVLATEHGLHELAPVFRAAVAGLDIGVLLHPDPRRDGGSVEDALLRAWARVEDGTADRTTELLDRLSHAGLRDVELATLARLGDEEAILARLPAILAENLPVEDVESLAHALARGGAVADAVCAAAESMDGVVPLTASQRYAIWHAAVGLQGELAGHSALQSRWLAVEGDAADAAVH